MNYFPLHVHSHFSLLDGLSKPEDIVSRCEEIGVDGCALTDHGSISGHIQFLSKMKKAGKKPLLGCEFYVSNEDSTVKNSRNRKNHHLCIIAKNDDGWRDLVEMVSKSHDEENFYHNNRLDLPTIFDFASRGNIMAFSGHIGSHMSNILYDDDAYIISNWKEAATHRALEFKEAFGENFFLEVQLMDQKNFPRQTEIGACIREISKLTGIPCVATQDAHYARKEDAKDQRILLCSNLGVTIQKASTPEFGMSAFFRSEQYHIPSLEEMQQWNTQEEIENTGLFASMVSDYENILRQPVLPKFECPDGMNPDEYLRKLCRDGWAKHITGKVPLDKHAEYADRVKMELDVLQGAGLSSYFLIVGDIINYVRDNGWLPGPGRGSAAGCLVSYLIGITSIDPIPYGLLFERFYNAGRNTPGRVSMPDIDMDVPKYSREKVIQYIRDKYGEEHVGQMVTFQTMKGRGALSDVFRAYGGISFNEIKDITKNIIEEHKISDELEKMKEERGESSIIQWCLEHTPDKLSEWCKINDDGELTGEYADRFEQAIRLEGTKTVQSKHAAGVIIAPEPLNQMCPMLTDRDTGNKIAGFEMEDLEAIGGIKFDVLGVAALDKSMGVAQDLLTGEIHEI